MHVHTDGAGAPLGRRAARLGVASALLVAGFGCGGLIDEPFDAQTEGPEGPEPVEVGTKTQAITGGWTSYVKGLVRLEFKSGHRCNGVLLGPGLIATSGRCIDRTGGADVPGRQLYTRWERVRIIYKPTEGEVMCLAGPCRDQYGDPEYIYTTTAWRKDYDGSVNRDIAFLVEDLGGEYRTFAADSGAPSPRPLNTGDYRRILGVGLSPGWGTIHGYGAHDDTTWNRTVPRQGSMYVEHWSTSWIRGDVRYGHAAPCVGDIGGPLAFEYAYDFVAGVLSQRESHSGYCPEHTDKVWWTRLSHNIGLIRELSTTHGIDDCTTFSSASLPGSGTYYRCW